MENLVFAIISEEESRGEEMARLLAKELDIPFYKDEILDIIARNGKIDKEIVKTIEDDVYRYINLPIDFSCGLALPFFTDIITLQDKVFIEKTKAVKNIIKDKSCIIFGKCYNYILRDYKNCVSVFVYAKEEDRIERVIENTGKKRRYCKKYLKIRDRKICSYYQYYTGGVWDNRKTYDILLNTSCLSLDICVKILKSIFLAYRNR